MKRYIVPGMMTLYDDTVRTIIEFSDAQIAALARLCRNQGISRAEAIRRAVDRLTANDQLAEAQAELQAGFGLWSDRQLEGRAFIEAIRAEWGEDAVGCDARA